MCGRAMLTVSAGDLEETFGYRAPRGYKPRFNIAPSQPLLVMDINSEREFREIPWGFVPGWSADVSSGRRMINARAESVASKPAFRDAFQRRRCLVVIDGYYEWQESAGARRPHRIYLSDGKPFTVAGIWEQWGTGAEERAGCAILTTAAAERVTGIHDRMPVIIPPARRQSWLRLETPVRELAEVLEAYEEDDLEAYEVSLLVNNPANDSPELLEPFTETEAVPNRVASSRARRRVVSSDVLDLFSTLEPDS